LPQECLRLRNLEAKSRRKPVGEVVSCHRPGHLRLSPATRFPIAMAGLRFTPSGPTFRRSSPPPLSEVRAPRNVGFFNSLLGVSTFHKSMRWVFFLISDRGM